MFEKEPSAKMTVAMNPINKNTIEANLKPRARPLNGSVDLLSLFLSGSLGYRQMYYIYIFFNLK